MYVCKVGVNTRFLREHDLVKSSLSLIPIICQRISVRRPFFLIIANLYLAPANFLFLLSCLIFILNSFSLSSFFHFELAFFAFRGQLGKWCGVLVAAIIIQFHAGKFDCCFIAVCGLRAVRLFFLGGGGDGGGAASSDMIGTATCHPQFSHGLVVRDSSATAEGMVFEMLSMMTIEGHHLLLRGRRGFLVLWQLLPLVVIVVSGRGASAPPPHCR
jgi:hypothetical protein